MNPWSLRLVTLSDFSLLKKLVRRRPGQCYLLGPYPGPILYYIQVTHIGFQPECSTCGIVKALLVKIVTDSRGGARATGHSFLSTIFQILTWTSPTRTTFPSQSRVQDPASKVGRVRHQGPKAKWHVSQNRGELAVGIRVRVHSRLSDRVSGLSGTEDKVTGRLSSGTECTPRVCPIPSRIPGCGEQTHCSHLQWQVYCEWHEKSPASHCHPQVLPSLQSVKLAFLEVRKSFHTLKDKHLCSNKIPSYSSPNIYPPQQSGFDQIWSLPLHQKHQDGSLAVMSEMVGLPSARPIYGLFCIC